MPGRTVPVRGRRRMRLTGVQRPRVQHQALAARAQARPGSGRGQRPAVRYLLAEAEPLPERC